MLNQENKLTASSFKYLIAMYQLQITNHTIRCVKIAETLGITKPSVHAMLKTLQKMNIVRKDYRGKVFFTDDGLQLAAKYSEYYKAVYNLFKACLSNESDIRSVSNAVLAEVSDEGLAQLYESTINGEKKGVQLCQL